ncbi:hypothetical protein B0J18DRAFT_482132 [Chaetomium sp. MPI-SDFR-AT-0129]|nr:hypothetical protein B0J18DRAFT_482132 [Chaetomium sp. MPI-SDFR-AT-0129]
MEASDDGAAEEVVVASSRPAPTSAGGSSSSSILTSVRSSSVSLSGASSSKSSLRGVPGALAVAIPSKLQNPLPAVSQKRRTPNASPVAAASAAPSAGTAAGEVTGVTAAAAAAGRPTRAIDSTPSRTSRYSTRDVVRDSQSQSQSPAPSVDLSTQQPPPPPRSPPQPAASSRMPRGAVPTFTAQTPKRAVAWTVDKIADALVELSEQVGQDHAMLVEYLLEEAEKQTRPPGHLEAEDAFAGMKSIALESGSEPPAGVEMMEVKFKQHSGEHGRTRGTGRRALYPVRCIKPDREPVPGYRFHHVEIRKNILAPNSMLNFVPHLRDVDPNTEEEKMYNSWLRDLESLDTKSGFQIQNRAQKLARRAQNEYAATLTPYLEPWLQQLAIDGCTKSTLIRYMASQAPHDDAAITPQQKSSLLDTHSDSVVGASPRSAKGAKMFTEAFDRVFDDDGGDKRKLRHVALRDILMLDKSVEPILDNKRAKDGTGAGSSQPKQLPRGQVVVERVEEALGSYSALGCLICFSHDCEHGEIERDNQKRCFSLEEIGGLEPTLRRKWAAQLEAQAQMQTPTQNGTTTTMTTVAARPTHQPCRNQCYRSYNTGHPDAEVEPWSESDVGVLEWMFAAIGHSPSLKAQCFVGAILGRHCWDVHRKLKELDLSLPLPEPPVEEQQNQNQQKSQKGQQQQQSKPAKPPKAIPWYDRKKKQLLGDWQDATVTHEHAVRELFTPCHHDGPCTAANGCPCASAGSHPVLCERFCLCTADECALKFTGCACHSSGKTCIQRQKEGRPCICVQLNRECDPGLCRGCGARERADPENAYDEALHATGCQNVAMQRGAPKAVLLGKSQLEACGYGLFTAEDIAPDEFVIEYTGELISHDEGVRREHRRGDVFDEENKVSYLFTLLEQEGIWVDAAMYGNLSRYINHASSANANIMPRIMYVNHEFRIKFIAIRDIRAGEELFFNYGDNFPNLTKKLVERNNEKAGGSSDGGSKNTVGGAKRKGPATHTARKTTSKNTFPDDGLDDDDAWLNGAMMPLPEDDDLNDEWGNPKRRKKRGGRRPGAGRKKKQPQPSAVVDITGADDDISPESQLLTENSNATAAAAASKQNNNDIDPSTPSRRRITKRSYASMVNPQSLNPSASNSDAGAGSPSAKQHQQLPILKKVSRRGGARPGAGRKPKHRPPGSAGATTTTAKPGTGSGVAGTGEATVTETGGVKGTTAIGTHSRQSSSLSSLLPEAGELGRETPIREKRGVSAASAGAGAGATGGVGGGTGVAAGAFYGTGIANGAGNGTSTGTGTRAGTANASAASTPPKTDAVANGTRKRKAAEAELAEGIFLSLSSQQSNHSHTNHHHATRHNHAKDLNNDTTNDSRHPTDRRNPPIQKGFYSNGTFQPIHDDSAASVPASASASASHSASHSASTSFSLSVAGSSSGTRRNQRETRVLFTSSASGSGPSTRERERGEREKGGKEKEGGREQQGGSGYETRARQTRAGGKERNRNGSLEGDADGYSGADADGYGGGGEMDADGDTDREDDVVDRSARKRQKPLRYRDEEE